jgi:surface polysaccharide O-acyltransferase-like enzyme
MTSDLRAGRPVPGWQWAALPPAAAAATSGAYLLWLGWHQLADKSAYEPWQVVGLALTAGAVVIAATWRSTALGLLTAAVVTVSLTTVWCWDAATTYSEDASLWPVGGIFLLVGATFGLTVFWAVTLLVRTLVRRRSPGPA